MARDIDMKTIEERAREYTHRYATPFLSGLETAEFEAYRSGATEQKAIDEYEYTEEMRKLNEEWKENLEIQRKMLVDKACEWLEKNQAHIISESGVWLMWTAFLKDFCKAMEE